MSNQNVLTSKETNIKMQEYHIIVKHYESKNTKSKECMHGVLLMTRLYVTTLWSAVSRDNITK